MKIVLKRICAYLIDIILISVLATLISSNKYINKDYNKYSKVLEEYNENYDAYYDYYEALEKSYSDEKITKEEYNELLEFDNNYIKELKTSYKDEKITKKEYNNIIKKLNDKYENVEKEYGYKLLKYSTIPTIINLMCILLYFVVIQFSFNGQTLGKKLLKLKVASNNEKELTMFNYFIRCLIVNEVFINIVSVICIFVLSKSQYFAYNKIIYVITYVLEMTILFTMVFDKNSRGLHDYISNTKVIEDKKE